MTVVGTVEVVLDDPSWGELTFDVRMSGSADGEPVVLLHGFPQTSRMWHHQLDALATAGYRAVAPDQRGYSPGARPEATEAYSTAALTGDVLALADALGFERFHLVGHDWGAAVAWQVAGRHGHRLVSLTALSVPHPRAFGAAIGADGADQADRSGYVAIFRQAGIEDGMLANDATGLRLVYGGSGLSEEEAAPHLEAMLQPGALRAALNWYRAADLTFVDGLGPVTIPTLYLWSTGDVALGREAAEATAGCVEGPYTFVELEGVDHWIAEHAPEETNRALLDHLAHWPV